MSEAFLGEIRPFGFNFPPKGWARCEGQILSIVQNQALFSLLGTTYGGDGDSTFALPNLQGRAPVGDGQGPGLQPYPLGAVGGVTEVTLTQAQLPTHTHPVAASNGAGDRRDPFVIAPPTGHRWAGSGHAQYSSGAVDATLHPSSVSGAGGNQPHPNESPYLVLNLCIALVGIFPSRN